MAQIRPIESSGHPVNVMPKVEGASISSREVRELLAQVAHAFPETAKVMDTASRLIVHLETLRHEATLPLSLGHYENVRTLLTQKAMVEVQHG